MKYLDIIIRLRDPRVEPMAAKEAVSYDCEKYGDVVFVDVKAGPEPEQMRLEGAFR